VIPRQLPAAAVNFAGRTAELRALTRRLDDAAGRDDGVMITVIAGSAGVGKTALAVQWAHRVAARFPDGQLYVNLRGFDPSGTPVTPAEAIRGFLAALQVPAGQIPAGLAAQAALYRSLLAGKRMLVVLDNARGAGQVRPLLPGSPGCPVLVTSRSPLLALAAGEGAYTFTLDLLDDAEATELLARRLGAERVAAEQSAVTELTSLCARLPLALAIAAARAAARPAFPLAAIAAGLADARGRLDVLEAEDAPDATSVRAVFSWSYRILSAPAARMFRLLGVHPGPDIAAAAAAALAGLPARAARQALAELTAAQLIAEQVPGRYAFHDLLRAYAEEQALAADDEAGRRAAVHRVLDHYLHTGYAAAVLLRPDRERIALDPPLPGTTPERFASYPQALGWLDAERKTLHAATALAAAHGLDAYAWRIPWTLATFSETTGYPEDWSATHEIALAAARRLGDPAGQAYTYRRVGLACLVLGTLDEAQAHLERALDLMRQLGNQRGEAAIHLDLGKVADRQERYRDALGHSRRCADLCQQMGHRVGQADALNAVAWCSVQLGEYDQAVTDCHQAIALQRELDDRRGEAASLDTLGYAYHHLGRYAEAADRYRDALAVLITLGDRLHQAEALTHLGDACHADGDQDCAATAWRQALVLLDELDQPSAREVRAKLTSLTSLTSLKAESAQPHPHR
jgi:tetratricopeptide (TPR) repeat protein